MLPVLMFIDGVLQETAEALSISRSDVQFTANSPISLSSVATFERESKKKISFSDEISDARSPDSDRTLKTTWESSPDQISPPARFTHDPFEHGLKQRTATQTFHGIRDRDINQSQSRSSIIYRFLYSSLSFCLILKWNQPCLS